MAIPTPATPATIIPNPATSINDVSRQRLTTAYYGVSPAPGTINPTIITILQQLLSAIFANCTPPAAKAMMTRHPKLAKARAYRHAAIVAVDDEEAIAYANAVCVVADQSSEEEYGQFQAAFPA